MNVTFGDPTPVKKAAVRDVYVLELKYMHGDADAYTSEKHSFKHSMDRAEKMATAVKVAFVLADGLVDVWDLSRDKAIKEIAALLPEEDPEEVSTWYENFWVSDCTNEGSGAMIDGIKLKYFDKAGAENTVEIRVDGKEL